MKTAIARFALVLILAAGLAAPPLVGAGRITGAFIPLDRATAAKTGAQWQSLLNRIKAAGLNTLIVQWSAEPPVLYFKDQDLDFQEQYDALERLLAAAGRDFSIILGLQNDPAYWKEITAPDQVLRDYFLIRLAQNERLQKALLKAFGKYSCWRGYYLPDEIDDFSWRAPARRRLLQDYLRRTIQTLRRNDPARAIAVSAFLRTRTAPEIAAETLRSLTADIGLDYLLIQDGAGNDDPPPDLISWYYRALGAARRAPELGIVLEAFQQTSGRQEPFAAEPAPLGRFARQIQAAAGFERLFIFSFPDYVDPARGPAAKSLYEGIKAE